MRVAITSNAPIVPSVGAARFVGSLALHVEDRNGHAFDRSYPAKADLLVDGCLVESALGFTFRNYIAAQEATASHSVFFTSVVFI